MARPKKNANATPKTKTVQTADAVKTTEKAATAVAKPVAEVKPAEVKAAAPKPAEKKPAAKKAAPKKAEKPAAAKKAPAKKAEAPAAAAPKKRAPRKPKTVTVDDVVAKISKRIDKTAAKTVAAEGKAAVDIKLYGAFEAHMYIEIKDGTVNVAPYDYIEKDLEAAVPVDVALAIADGKTTVQEAVENGSLYVFGNVQFAMMFAKLFK
ncbi:MAG: SCP2 sterol-binding domain-containing protein [Oscillospiraceae bacterium]|nr:SCP2 sterol-binding domain-containing protein [Oscillospiraceae bacterium]